MKVLVTGVNGFLAANVVRELNRRGVPVRGLARASADLSALAGADCEVMAGSYTDEEDLDRAIRGCNFVVHAAAFTGPTPTALKHYLQPNVEGTRNVIRACLKEGVRRLVYVSTVNTIGYGTAENPGREDWPLNGPPFSRSGYALSKVLAEGLIRESVEGQGLDAVIVNPSFIIGPYDAKPSSNRMLQIYYEKSFTLLPPGGKNFVYVGDVAVAICNALEKGRAGERYILANRNLTLNAFFDLVEPVVGRKQRRIHVPGTLIRLAGFAGGLANVFGSSYQLDPVTAHILSIRNFYSSEKAVRELGMPQTPIEQAIREAWDWLERRKAAST
ncbi:MAG: NAD-dependent epimerase/dehydratase family protein [Bacteroidales bacterium]